MATCPQCGYELQAFEGECPRCRNLGIRPQVHPGEGNQPRREYTIGDLSPSSPARRRALPPIAWGMLLGCDGMVFVAVLLKVTGAVVAEWLPLVLGAAVVGAAIGLVFGLVVQAGRKA